MIIKSTNAAIIERKLDSGEISQWDNHATCPPADWKYAVENNDTRQGYWDWVISEIEANA